MDPVPAAFGALLCWGVGDYLIQNNARKIGNVEALLWISLVGMLATLPLVAGQLHLLGVWPDFLLLALLGAVTFIAAMVDFEALKVGKLAVVDMVIALELPLTILLAIVFLHDSLDLWQVALIVLLIAGVIMIALDGMDLSLKLEAGVLFALAAAGSLALLNFLTAVGSRTVTPLMAVWAPALFSAVFCLVVILKRGSAGGVLERARNNLTLVIAMGVVDFSAWIFYAYATSLGELSIVNAITESFPAVALMLGVWLGREKISKRQYLGAAVALLASIALAMTL